MEVRSIVHEHPLKFFDGAANDDNRSLECYACDDVIYGPRYVCEICSFALHKSCCEMPPQIQTQAFHPHPLRCSFMEHRNVCDECETLSDSWFYTCIQCGMFNVDFKCALTTMLNGGGEDIRKIRKGKRNKTTINHFSHPHQLTRYLCKIHTMDSACKQNVYGSLIYTCLPCDFVIHESCVNKMPKQVLHSLFHSHPNHVLRSRVLNHPSTCDACGETVEKICFTCSKCDVNLHVSCATYRTRAIKCDSHLHLHHLLQMGKCIAMGKSCVACHGDCGGDSFLGCIKCKFYVHVECAQLPPMVRHLYHRHLLVLTTPFVEDDSEEYYCDICETERNPKHHVYRCEECNYIAHIDCLINPKAEPPKIKFWDHQPTEVIFNIDEKYDIDDENSPRDETEFNMDIQLIHFMHPHPLARYDKENVPFVCDRCGELCRGSVFRCSTCLSFNLDIKCATLDYKLTEDATKKVKEIRTTILHFSHYHMLTRCKMNISQVDQYEDYFCKACKGRLHGLDLVYACTICGNLDSFILHESCLKDMPMQVESPFHPQHVLVPCPEVSRWFGYRCLICRKYIRGIGFRCNECWYVVHVSCAKYTTREIRHKSHVIHKLQHLGKGIFIGGSDRWCGACFEDCSDTFFGCISCHFYMHLECLELPSLVKHIRHLHPLTLTKSVVEDDSGEYFCDICETERNPEHDVYYCKECNFIAHIDCVISTVEPPEEIFESLVPRPTPSKELWSQRMKELF